MRTLTAVLLVAGTAISARAQEFHYWGEELEPVLGVLQGANLSVSIGLAGRCNPTGLPGFSQFRGPFVSVSPLSALREVAASAAMTVEEDANRRIRMTEVGMPNDLLNVRIKHVVFENHAHHDIHSPTLAAELILSAPEVRTFMEAHKIAAPQLIGPRAVPGNSSDDWPPDSPHISGSIDDVTVSEALDRVLASFPGGVLVYWNCPDMRYGSEPVTTTSPQSSPTQKDASYQRLIHVFFFRARESFGGKPLVGGW
jgi:hypothetical protein